MSKNCLFVKKRLYVKKSLCLTMREALLTLLFMVLLPAFGQEQDLKSLYQQIDEAIEHSPEYVADYESRIDKAKTACRAETSPERRLPLLMQVFDLYKAYRNDSAMAYIEQYIQQAEKLGRRQEADEGRVLLAFQCSTVGLYTESLGVLHTIDSRQLSRDVLTDYYNTCLHVCGELSFYTQLQSMRDYYSRLRDEYRDSLFQAADPHSEVYLLQQETQLLGNHRFDEALAVNDQRLHMVREGTRDFAIVAFYRHLIYNGMGKVGDSKYWLAQSGLCDVRQATMDQASLLVLAQHLNAEGDLERAYRYIRFTWDCNNRFNTRMRSWQIAPILDVIDSSYREQLHHGNRMLVVGLVLLALFVLTLAASLFFLRRRNRQLDTARQALHDSNAQLAALNEELQRANSRLSERNDQFALLNSQLAEANQVKEEYIGRFLSLCAQYVDKLDNYRKMVNKKMKNKELDELFQITKSTELKEKEIEELNQNFDSVFLHLFPHFVDDFNALLQPDMQVRPKEENRLTVDLRIFALIRLGIDDSSKIAEFLHYSVNTIYNYRARIKNGALDNREQFERRVKMLGMLR